VKIVRYVLFSILVLIVSIYIRRPDDMPKSQQGIIETVTGYFPGKGDRDSAKTDEEDEEVSDNAEDVETEDDEQDEDEEDEEEEDDDDDEDIDDG
jgi:hypothetical protein